jgi:hypothetical protein
MSRLAAQGTSTVLLAGSASCRPVFLQQRRHARLVKMRASVAPAFEPNSAFIPFPLNLRQTQCACINASHQRIR